MIAMRVVCALAMLLPSVSPAQSGDPAPGSKIRVVLKSVHPHGEGESAIRIDYQLGRFLLARGDSIDVEFGIPTTVMPELSPFRARVSVPRTDVETYAGHRPFGAVKGAGLGLLIGGAAGLIAGAMVPRAPYNALANGRATNATLYGLLGVILGTPVGAVVGASTPVEVWTPIDSSFARGHNSPVSHPSGP